MNRKHTNRKQIIKQKETEHTESRETSHNRKTEQKNKQKQ